MARATGIQVTGSTVRVVDLEGSPKKFKVRGFAEGLFDPDAIGDGDTSLSRCIRDAFKTSKASKEHVILGLGSRDCIIREITVPFTSQEQIAKVIKFESESHLHSCTIEDVVICFHKVGETGSRSTLIVVAVRKDYLKTILEALDRNGIDPLAIDLDASGLFGSLTTLPASRDCKTYVVCEVGYTSTMISLIKDGNLRSIRSVRIGVESITARVSRDLDIDIDEARTRTQAIMVQDLALDDDLFVRSGDVDDSGPETTKTSGELERDIIHQRQEETVQRLKQEIYRTMSTVKLEESPECVFIVGPGSNLPRMGNQLAEALDLPVKTLDLLGFAEHKFESDRADILNSMVPVPAGLALKHLGHDPLNFDFRQEEFIFARKFDRLKVPLMCMVILFSTVNFFWFFFIDKLDKNEELKINNAARYAVTDFDKVTNPAKMKKGYLKHSPRDEKAMKALYAGASTSKKPSHSERIRYVGITIKKLHSELREVYGLSNSGGVKGKSSKFSRNTKKYIPADPADFTSAAARLEQVFLALRAVGLKENFSIDRLNVKADLVDMAISMPDIIEFNGKTRRYLDVLADLKVELKKIPDFESLEDSNYVSRDDGRPGAFYSSLKARFRTEGL